jgi:hypothetical protein
LVVQAIAIGIDEYVFHLKRGLPKWERIGHPIDTLSVLACVAFVLFVPYSPSLIKVYVSLAVLSCLMVTKDEFIHKHVCPAAEQWLHAVLFVNHSLVLIALGLMWPAASEFSLFLWIQGSLTALFFLYQVIYWNWIWKESTTISTTN